MPGPSPRLEAIVGVFIPPACREEVLGDLREKYVSPMQYIGLAICVLPFVIFSRIRRTSDPLIRLTEALLIFGSFFAATWYRDHSLLSKPEGFFRIILPSAALLIAVTFSDLWRGGSPWLTRLVSAAAFAIGFGFNSVGAFAASLSLMGLHAIPGLRMHEASGPSTQVDRGIPNMSVAAISALVAAVALILALAGISDSAWGTAIVVFVAVALPRNPRKE